MFQEWKESLFFFFSAISIRRVIHGNCNVSSCERKTHVWYPRYADIWSSKTRPCTLQKA
uniref:Uncharacterized protein n=1 Tax=Octopus bimaculoides TaxID=37653 RepID=A0A0L8HY61_OCTBM